MTKLLKFIVLFIFITGFAVNAADSKCESIAISNSMTFIVTATIEGPKGVKKFPALIDTGATHTFIPKKIADKVGFNSQKTVEFITAGGMKSFDIISIKKLSFLGAVFNDINVAAIDRNTKVVKTSTKNNLKSENSLKEIAIIGMSELSKIKFVYEKNNLTVCSE